MANEKMIHLREAESDDSKMIWEWANDPVVRQASFSSDPIPWEGHVKWFDGKLKDPNCYMFIGINSDDVPFGLVRFDVEGDFAEIGINISSEFRGKGYGVQLIDAGSREIFSETDISKIHANIRPENKVSIKVFEKAGFSYEMESEVKGCASLRYVRHRV